VLIKSARQSAFTMQISVVRPLSCAFEKNTRQSLCHALYLLCRASTAHSNQSVSRSVRQWPATTTNQEPQPGRGAIEPAATIFMRGNGNLILGLALVRPRLRTTVGSPFRGRQ
jgi:hypothetical protein